MDVFNRLLGKRYLWIFFFVLGAISLHASWTHMTQTDPMPGTWKWLNFQEGVPFQNRLLLPLLYQGIDKLFSVSLSSGTGLNAPLQDWYNVFLLIIDALAIFFASLFLFLTIRTRFSFFIPFFVNFILTFILLLSVYFNYINVMNRSLYYGYDMLELMFMSAMFWVAASTQDRVRYLLPFLVFIATFNKETSIFGILFFIIFSYERGWKKSDVQVILISLIIYIIVKAGINYYFYSWPKWDGTNQVGVIPHIELNISQLLNPLFYFSFLSNYGYAWVLALIFAGWTKTRIGKNLFLGILLWFGIMFIVGVTRELRVFGPMVIPLVYIIALGIERAIIIKSEIHHA